MVTKITSLLHDVQGLPMHNVCMVLFFNPELNFTLVISDRHLTLFRPMDDLVNVIKHNFALGRRENLLDLSSVVSFNREDLSPAT